MYFYGSIILLNVHSMYARDEKPEEHQIVDREIGAICS